MKTKTAQHQEEILSFTFTNRSKGVNRILNTLPTGGGKTYTFGLITKKLIEERETVLILTDRKSLLSQTGEAIGGFFGLQCSYIKAGVKHPETKTKDGEEIRLFIGMVNTVKNRMSQPMWQHVLKKVTCIICDEAHEKTFKKIINDPLFKDCLILGFTATPVYSSKKDFMRDDYSAIFAEYTENDLINEGYLVQPRTVGEKANISKLRKKAGEYQEKEVIALQKSIISYERVIEIYLKECDIFLKKVKENNPIIFDAVYKNTKHLKSIFFGVNSAHVLEITQAFNHAGISARYILSDTKIQTAKERDQTEQDFKDNKFTILVNCQITTKGYDAPDVLIIGKLYLTASLAKDNQVGGRGSRPNVNGLFLLETAEERREAIAQSRKPYFTIIDYLGNFAVKDYGNIRGRWNDPKPWKHIFEKGEEKPKGDAPEKQCPKCEQMVRASLKICNALTLDLDTDELKECGYKFEPRANQTEVNGEFIEIVLNETDLNNKTPTEISHLYKDGAIGFNEAIKAIRKQGDCFLIDFAIIQEYKSVEKWIQNRFYKSYSALLQRREELERERLNFALKSYLKNHLFAEIQTGLIKKDIEILKEQGKNYLEIAPVIKQKYLS